MCDEVRDGDGTEVKEVGKSQQQADTLWSMVSMMLTKYARLTMP
jgi:hypothetical protein